MKRTKSQQTRGGTFNYLPRLVRSLDVWMMTFDSRVWRGAIIAANYNIPRWPRPLAFLRFWFLHGTGHLRPAWEWLNLKVMAWADRLERRASNAGNQGQLPRKGTDEAARGGTERSA